MSDEKFRLDDLQKKGEAPGAEEEVREKFEAYKKKNRSRIPFINEIEELYDYLVSGKVTNKDKAIIIGTLLYFINPFDLLPDITPILGFTDDFALIAFVYKYIVSSLKKRQ